MPFCPICKAEYRAGFRQCSDCLADLVDSLREAEVAQVILLWEGVSGKTKVLASFRVGNGL